MFGSKGLLRRAFKAWQGSKALLKTLVNPSRASFSLANLASKSLYFANTSGAAIVDSIYLSKQKEVNSSWLKVRPAQL